jgi:hypothetical protein
MQGQTLRAVDAFVSTKQIQSILYLSGLAKYSYGSITKRMLALAFLLANSGAELTIFVLNGRRNEPLSNHMTQKFPILWSPKRIVGA